MKTTDLVDYAPPLIFEEEFEFEWSMTRSERIALLHILKRFKPSVSIEVGTFRGGSLQPISMYSDRVYSFDIEHRAELTAKFDNVAFVTGDSKIRVPETVAAINKSEQEVGFVLIDGDHSEHGVRSDISAILELVPKRPIALLVHDSFNPRCRRGILTSPLERCPWVHYVEVDFLSGIYLPGRGRAADSMYGGFCFALMLPVPREGQLEIFESQYELNDICRRFSFYSGFNRFFYRASRALLGRARRSLIGRKGSDFAL